MEDLYIKVNELCITMKIHTCRAIKNKMKVSHSVNSLCTTNLCPLPSFHHLSIHSSIYLSILTSSPTCQSSGALCQPGMCADLSPGVYVRVCQGQRLYVMAASRLQIHVIDWIHVPVHTMTDHMLHMLSWPGLSQCLGGQMKGEIRSKLKVKMQF